MSSKRYADEFKIEAVKQVTERDHAVGDVSMQLGVSQHSLYKWIKQFGVPPDVRQKFKLMEVIGILLIGGELGLLSLLGWAASQRNPLIPTLHKPHPVPS